MSHAMPHSIDAADDTIYFDKSVDFLRGQIPMTKAEWGALEPKIQFRAFCVSRLTDAYHVHMLQQQLVSAAENKESYADSWKHVKDLIDTGNMKEISPGYWETVYRTNMNTAYTAGKLTEFEETKPEAIQLFFINDDRQSEICHDLFQQTNGLAMPVDHPFWTKYGYPPYHFNCRTTFRGIYKSQISRDVNVENPPMSRFRKFKPAEGFGGNPVQKESWWRLTENMAIHAAQYGIFNDVEKFAKDNGLFNFSLGLVNGIGSVKDADGNVITEGVKKAIKEIKEHEKDMAKILIANKHTFFFTPRHKAMKSYDGILDGKIAELKQLQSTSINAIFANIKDADFQKANTVCIQLHPKASYTKEQAIDMVKDIFSGTHITSQGKKIEFDLAYVNEVLIIDKNNRISIIKK